MRKAGKIINNFTPDATQPVPTGRYSWWTLGQQHILGPVPCDYYARLKHHFGERACVLAN